MGCGISIFEYHSQPNAKATGFGFGNLHKQKIGTNNNTACTSTNREELIIGGGVFSRKNVSSSSPSPPPPPPKKDLFLGFTRKFILQHGCSTGHEKRLVKVKEEGVPSKKSSNNEYLISSLSHKKEEDDGREKDIVVGEIVVEIKGVKAITTEDDGVIIIRNADADADADADCDHDRNNNTNTTTTNCIIMDNEDQPRNIDDDDDGPPIWIASPSFREYCFADSDLDESDSFKPSHPHPEFTIQMPKDNQDICNVRKASRGRGAKKALRKVIAIHRPKPKPKPKPDPVPVKNC